MRHFRSAAGSQSETRRASPSERNKEHKTFGDLTSCLLRAQPLSPVKAAPEQTAIKGELGGKGKTLWLNGRAQIENESSKGPVWGDPALDLGQAEVFFLYSTVPQCLLWSALFSLLFCWSVQTLWEIDVDRSCGCTDAIPATQDLWCLSD